MKRTIAILTGLFCTALQANVIQYFTGISYSNPSGLFKVKDNELIFGGTFFYTNVVFTGEVLNFNTGQYGSGRNGSYTTSLLPYGRIAKRVNDKLVLAVDVTQPFHSNLNFGEDSFTRYAVTHNLLTDTDISPRLSLSLSKRLHVGAGLNLNFLKNNEVNFALPTGPVSYDTLVNRASGFGQGFNLGVTYGLSQRDFLEATYYSKIKQNTSGYSRFNNNVSNDHNFSFYMPSTTVLSYTHLFNKAWLLNLNAFYVQWNANQFVRLNDTAAPQKNFVFPMMFDPSWAFLGVIRHQYNEKLGLAIVGMVDNGPEKDNIRPLVFPSDRQYFIGLSAEYNIKENSSLQITYGHGFSNTTLNNTVQVDGTTIPFTIGKVNIDADVLELKLTMKG